MFRTAEKILNSTGSTKARRYPLSYIYSGYYVWGRGTLYFQGENGYWYSTVASSSTNAYRLSISDPTLNPQDNGGNMNGFPLRFLSTPPAQPKPAGIRFRIYTQEITIGAMATWAIRTHKPSYGLLRLILILTLTF